VAHQKRLKAVEIEWEKNPVNKKPVGPSKETVINGSYAPLSRPLFIYVNKSAAKTRPEVKAFVEYYLKNAAKLSEEVKYVSLPPKAYELTESRFAKMQAGSAFLGKEHVGLNIEDVLAREQK
jgi:phosphate transport system substrate-binding protein